MQSEFLTLSIENQVTVLMVLGIFIKLEKRVVEMNDTLASRARLFVLQRLWNLCTMTEYTHVETYKKMALGVIGHDDSFSQELKDKFIPKEKDSDFSQELKDKFIPKDFSQKSKDEFSRLDYICNHFEHPVLDLIEEFLAIISPEEDDHECFHLLYNVLIEGGIFVPLFPFFKKLRKMNVLHMLGELQQEIISDEHTHTIVNTSILRFGRMKGLHGYSKMLILNWYQVLCQVSSILLKDPFFGLTLDSHEQYIRFCLSDVWKELGFDDDLFPENDCSNPYLFMESENESHKPSPQNDVIFEYKRVFGKLSRVVGKIETQNVNFGV
jgi:ribonucleotide reductase beta subunit family protein with ferritin-like domain